MNDISDQAYWLVFAGDKLLLAKEGERYTVPLAPVPPLPIAGSVLEVALHEGIPCRAFSLPAPPVTELDGFVWIGLRASYALLDEALYRIAGKACELLFWDRHSRFCPVCGTATVRQTVISKVCPSCGNEIFPSVSPAILVLIRKGDAVLLVHARNFRSAFYGLVAGFLETGETLEECVRREVREETGLEIAHLTYFGNQAWPFPSNLMVGFTADYAGGTLRLQDEELSAGNFFTRDNLPELPSMPSLARQMIDWWLAQRAE